MLNPFNPLFYLNILLVDDEMEFIHTFRDTAALFGHNVVGCTTIESAQKTITESYAQMNPFDAVFIDYLMPNLNGVEVAGILKKMDPDLILIAITRDKTRKTKIDIISSLAFKLYITKDIDITKLQILFEMLVATKIEQLSGDESRIYRRLKENQFKMKENQTKTKAKNI